MFKIIDTNIHNFMLNKIIVWSLKPTLGWSEILFNIFQYLKEDFIKIWRSSPYRSVLKITTYYFAKTWISTMFTTIARYFYFFSHLISFDFFFCVLKINGNLYIIIVGTIHIYTTADRKVKSILNYDTNFLHSVASCNLYVHCAVENKKKAIPFMQI
jgi:hypothetical protein